MAIGSATLLVTHCPQLRSEQFVPNTDMCIAQSAFYIIYIEKWLNYLGFYNYE